MRGLVTLAAVFALPASFPRRDLIVLSAFAVVLTTLVLQGLTLAPLARWLKLDGDDGLCEELIEARREMANAALSCLRAQDDPRAEHWCVAFEKVAKLPAKLHCGSADTWKELGLAATSEQRLCLERLRSEERIGPDAFLILQQELDFMEVALATDAGRRVEEV